MHSIRRLLLSTLAASTLALLCSTAAHADTVTFTGILNSPNTGRVPTVETYVFGAVANSPVSVEGSISNSLIFDNPNLRVEVFSSAGTLLSREFFGSQQDATRNFGVFAFSFLPPATGLYGLRLSNNDRSGDPFAYSVTLSNVTATPQPEPATLLLLGTGLAGVVGAARRRRRTVNS